MNTRRSGLTEADAKLIADYLNTTYKLSDSCKWDATYVASVQAQELGINGGDPFVSHSLPRLRQPPPHQTQAAKEKSWSELKVIKQFFTEHFSKQQYGNPIGSGALIITDIEVLHQLKEEARNWKQGKTSQIGLFQKSGSKETKDINIRQLMADISMHINNIQKEEHKGDYKSEINLKEYEKKVTDVLTKITTGKEKEITDEERSELIRFNDELKRSHADSNKIMKPLEQLIDCLPKMTPPGTPPGGKPF